MTTPRVQYGYASGAANTIRPTSLTYPNGHNITYGYGTTNGIDDAASRISGLVDDDPGFTHLADYKYLGRGTAVDVDYTEPDIRYALSSLTGSNDPDTGDIYTGFDRFGRIKDSRWYNYGTSEDADRIKYGYDRAGNRTWRQNTVAEAVAKAFDELYGYDAIHRLKDLDRGTLDALKTAVTDKSFAECWGLDETGNWKDYRQDDDGDGWDLIQKREANPVNEIAGVTNTLGPAWAQPAYNRAGNMTSMPQPSAPGSSYTATYDAWNRLTKLVDAATGQTVAEYQYDGANRRTVRKSYTSGSLSETRHFYYTEPGKWQSIEERLGRSPDTADPDRQFVWGTRYIDDLVCRDRSTSSVLDERLYALQDANWNVTSIADATGVAQERFAFTAYGQLMFLDADFSSKATSDFAFEILYAGYRFDSQALAFVRHRVLLAFLGAWIRRDPLGLSAGINLYQYTSSNPANRVDPFGELEPLTECLVGAAIGGAIGGLFSLLSSYVNNENACQTKCKALVNVIAGALGGCLGAVLLNPCLATVLSNFGATVGAAICDSICGCTVTVASVLCSLVLSLLTSVLTCLGAGALDLHNITGPAKEIYDVIANALASVVGTAVGVDMAVVCGL